MRDTPRFPQSSQPAAPRAVDLFAENAIMGIWETPSAAMLRRASEARSALAQANIEANALLARATAVAQVLQPLGITLAVPTGR